MRAALIAALLAAFPFTVHAQQPNMGTGNYWTSKCGSADHSDNFQCIIYTAGVVGGMQSMMDEKSMFFCIPPNVTYAQLGAVFAKYLRENPEETHLKASMLVGFAMIKAYPCPQK